jgi:hypothetical protein
MSNSFFNVFNNGPSRRGSTAEGQAAKPYLSRSDSRRAKEGSTANMASIAKEDSEGFGIRKEESVSKNYGIRKEESVSKKKKDPKKRTKHDINNSASRRGSMVPGSASRRVSAVFYVPETIKTADNQIINLTSIRDDMHTFRMIKWCADLTSRLRSPMDDLETLVVPITSKSFVETLHDLFTISSNFRYRRHIEILNWTRDEEMIEDVLCAFSKQIVDFEPTDMTNKMMESYASFASWEAIHKALSDIYIWFPMDNEYKIRQVLQELGPKIADHLLVVIGNWVCYLRQSHVALCSQIQIWFSKFSATDWKQTKIPVVYGAFRDGYDIIGLFGQILHGCPTLDLVQMNLICTKISVSFAKYPNQKDFIHLDLFREFGEFKAKVQIMSKLFHLCRALDVDKVKIFAAVEMYAEAKDSKANKKGSEEKLSVFTKIHRAKQEMVASSFDLKDLKKSHTSSAFAAAYPKVLSTIVTPYFSPISLGLAASFTGTKKYDLPKIYLKFVGERRKIEAIVQKLSPKKEIRNQESSFAPAISIIPEISIMDTDPDDAPKTKAPPPLEPSAGAADPILKPIRLADVELEGNVTMPESVCTTRFTLNYEDKDTLEAIFGISFGNVDFGDIKRILTVIGCTVITEDGVGLVVSHPRSKINMFFTAPFPDLSYKLYALDGIKNLIQDSLGIYFENFDYKM